MLCGTVGMMGSEQPLLLQCGAGVLSWTTQGISPHVLFYFLPVGSRACCHCRATNYKGRGSGSTKPKLPSLLSAFCAPKLPWRGGRWGCRANTPALLRCSQADFAQCSSVGSHPHSAPAAPLNPLWPSLGPREQNLLVPGTATKPDLHQEALTLLSHFCHKHTQTELSFQKPEMWFEQPVQDICSLIWKCLIFVAIPGALAGPKQSPAARLCQPLEGGQGHLALIPSTRCCPTTSTAQPWG